MCKRAELDLRSTKVFASEYQTFNLYSGHGLNNAGNMIVTIKRSWVQGIWGQRGWEKEVEVLYSGDVSCYYGLIYVTERSRKLLRDVRLCGGLKVRCYSALSYFFVQ